MRDEPELLRAVVGRGEHQQQPTLIIVICGEDVRYGGSRDVVFRVDLYRLALDPHLPLERSRDVIVAVLEAQAEDVTERTTHRLLDLQPGELERPASAVDDPALVIAS